MRVGLPHYSKAGGELHPLASSITDGNKWEELFNGMVN